MEAPSCKVCMCEYGSHEGALPFLLSSSFINVVEVWALMLIMQPCSVEHTTLSVVPLM